MIPVLALYWSELGLEFQPVSTAIEEAAPAITRITGGNFRFIERTDEPSRPDHEHQRTLRHHR